MSKVADPLREFADRHADKLGAAIVGDTQTAESSAWHYLYKLANQIDREHERRMRQAKDEMRKATCRYFSRVVEDYKHSRKWKRKDYE